MLQLMQSMDLEPELAEYIDLAMQSSTGLLTLINAKLLTMMLKKLGHRVCTAMNGRQAVEALSGQHYDLILMDVQMPEMDGVEATRHIRTNPEDILDASIPIIALTTHTLKGDRDAFLAAGMNDVLSKPIDAQALREILDRAVKQAAAQ
ncbi:response regulator [Rhabdochromatium marinum]|uniref:response regulator n=1 Tax=Rhabdochromatium marinum TaxID=48729 RepID=UPI001F5B649C|nr:response regulator [Rhabdochromatium marinum]